jgi:hypothetical protein
MVDSTSYKKTGYPFNSFNERLEILGDIILNLEYWDCECSINYIHPITEKYCKICNAYEEDSLNSRENEVVIHLQRGL